MLYIAGHIAYDYLFSIDDFPKANASCYISKFETYFGGGAANTAYACAKLGEKANLISVVGEDFRNSAYEKHLKKSGVGLLHVKALFGKKTPRAYMFVEPHGNFLSYFYWGAGEAFKKMNPPKLKLKDGDLIHIATGDPDYNVRLSEYGNISFDPSYDTPMYKEEHMQKILKNTKFLFCNRHEMGEILKLLNNVSPLDYGVEAIIMSEGSGGTVVKTRNYTIKVPAVKAKVVDTIGAGDAHRAGFLCAYLKGESLKRCAQIASSVASFVVEKRGAQTNIPGWKAALKRTE
ncbi:MAG: carbohydrate kinase family protein [Candidatus Micrarchaeota archaeon]